MSGARRAPRGRHLLDQIAERRRGVIHDVVDGARARRAPARRRSRIAASSWWTKGISPPSSDHGQHAAPQHLGHAVDVGAVEQAVAQRDALDARRRSSPASRSTASRRGARRTRCPAGCRRGRPRSAAASRGRGSRSRRRSTASRTASRPSRGRHRGGARCRRCAGRSSARMSACRAGGFFSAVSSWMTASKRSPLDRVEQRVPVHHVDEQRRRTEAPQPLGAAARIGRCRRRRARRRSAGARAGRRACRLRLRGVRASRTPRPSTPAGADVTSPRAFAHRFFAPTPSRARERAATRR